MGDARCGARPILRRRAHAEALRSLGAAQGGVAGARADRNRVSAATVLPFPAGSILARSAGTFIGTSNERVELPN